MAAGAVDHKMGTGDYVQVRGVQQQDAGCAVAALIGGEEVACVVGAVVEGSWAIHKEEHNQHGEDESKSHRWME